MDKKMGKRPTFVGRIGFNRDYLIKVLGSLWILDALLQFQPKMFGNAFFFMIILPGAHGQPTPIAWSITSIGHFLMRDGAVWNFLFASIQLAIGVGILMPRYFRQALTLSFIWILGVWWFGEGLGMLLTGTASPLTGAPGAVLIYGVIGLMVWPRAHSVSGDASADANSTLATSAKPKKKRVGLDSAVGASGPFGTTTGLGAWAALWVLFAILWLSPFNRSSQSIFNMLSSAAVGQPGWYGQFLNSTAHFFAGDGTGVAWILAIGSLAIGLGPLVTRKPMGFFIAGAALELLFWVTGQAFGGMFTGMGTDPNAGLLVALLAVSVMPTRISLKKKSEIPVQVFIRDYPGAVASGAAACMIALLLSATYPISAAGASVAISSGSSSGGSASTNGVTKMANMSMANPQPNWKYTGPPLSAHEVSILTGETAVINDGHAMQTPNCNAAPTATQIRNALSLVEETTAALAPYQTFSNAIAAGYHPVQVNVDSNAYPVVHYMKGSEMGASSNPLDPNHIPFLMYAFTPNGPVLAGAMYIMPKYGVPGPMPGGCLTQWHRHTDICVKKNGGIALSNKGCGAIGLKNLPTPYMLHVFTLPVPGGALAVDPPDLTVMEAAIMAQQAGHAPIGPYVKPPPPTAGIV